MAANEVGLPLGFQLDAPPAVAAAAVPGLPEGFTLDQPSVAADVAKSGGIGLAKGTLGVVGMGGDTRELGGAAAAKIAGYLGASPEHQEMARKVANVAGYLNPLPSFKTSADMQKDIEGVTGQFHEPQTTAGHYAQTVGEFVPAAIGGEGSVIPRLIKQAVIPGLASEAAGQATAGTAAEPYARLATAVGAGGLADLRKAPDLAPTAAQLKAAGSQGFEAARNLGVEIKPQSVQNFAAKVIQDLDQGLGVDANLAPKTHGILSDVAKGPPAGGNSVATIDNLQSLRRKLGNAAGSIDKTERMAASSAKNALDDYLANLPSSDVIAGNPQAAAAILRDANANYAAASRSEGVNAKLVRAELRAAASNSGQNVANTIRQRMADILINPTLQRGYSKDELAQIEKIVRGTVTGNAARFAKNVFGGGGGIGTLATVGVGAAAGGLPGIALAAPGIAGRWISDASTMRQVRKLDQMLRSRAPLSAQQAASQPLPQSQHLNLLKALLLSNAATLPTRMPSAQAQP